MKLTQSVEILHFMSIKLTQFFKKKKIIIIIKIKAANNIQRHHSMPTVTAAAWSLLQRLACFEARPEACSPFWVPYLPIFAYFFEKLHKNYAKLGQNYAEITQIPSFTRSVPFNFGG